ncbi:MAG: sugar ABC transporter permease, partial [Proteobacteria bacterium]|nr:sugar ABC transporter permease [Pseudomonadota bacterium]
AVLIVVTLLPTVYMLLTSLTPPTPTNPATQWDFDQPAVNYALLLSDTRFHNSVWVQVKLSFWTVGLQLLLGLLFALLLNYPSRLLEALRTVFLIPMVLPPIVVAIIWKVLYTPDISPVHWGLRALGWDMPALITHPDFALLAIIIADTWEWFPLTMLMILAALQTIPRELHEAARVDGGTPLQLTVYVTLPYIRGTLLVAGLFRLIDSIKAFPLIYILTDGGPGSVTEVTNYYSFAQAFNFSYLGFSSAITVVLVAATLLLSWAVVRMTGWGTHGD